MKMILSLTLLGCLALVSGSSMEFIESGELSNDIIPSDQEEHTPPPVFQDSSAESKIKACIRKFSPHFCKADTLKQQKDCLSKVSLSADIFLKKVASKIALEKVCQWSFCPTRIVKQYPHCEKCTSAFKMLMSLAKDLQAEFLEELNKRCAKLENEKKAFCQEFAKELQHAYEVMYAELTPEKICEEMELCEAKKSQISDIEPTVLYLQ